jgi:hypothetical protein
MQVLQIINKQRQPLAKITWESPSIVNLSVSTDIENREGFESYLTTLLEQFKQDGIPFRTGNKTTNTNGVMVYTDEKLLIKPDDEQFLGALKDAINNLPFISSDQRFFATL